MVTRALCRTEYIHVQRKFYFKILTCTIAVDEIGCGTPLPPTTPPFPLPDPILCGIRSDSRPAIFLIQFPQSTPRLDKQRYHVRP